MINNDIQAMHGLVAEWRQHLHQYPGTAYEETKAAELVVEKLREWGITFEAGIAKTGIVATIKGRENSSGKTIGLRADMDALDMTETSGQPWASKIPGKMHGCGHDGHTAMLLGTAKYLSENPDFNGTVHLIFQPAEEGKRGAESMIKEGLFERYPCDEIYGIHNWPLLPLGHAAITSGPLLAAVDSFKITVDVGELSGHPAVPERITNPIFVASRITTGIEDFMIECEAEGHRVSFHPGCSTSSSTQENVVGKTVTLGGTARTFDETIRNNFEEKLQGLCTDMAKFYQKVIGDEFYNPDIVLEYNRITDVTINSPTQTAFAVAAAQEILGTENVHKFTPMLGGEDFSTLVSGIGGHGAFILLGQGAGPDSLHTKMCHNTGYDYNDDLSPIGIEYFVKLVQGLMPIDANQRLGPADLDLLK